MRKALAAFPLSPAHMDYLIDGLMLPSLRGVDTHGVRLFPTYLKELEGGRSKAQPELRFTNAAPALATLDAGQALGIVAGFEAVHRSIELAESFGIAAVSVRNSNHFGAASNYTLAAAKRGYACLCFSNSDALVAPHGGIEKILGTNPLSFAAPASDGELYCLDMATSQVSYSKIMQKFRSGEAIPENWAVGVDYEADVLGALQALGGYKGQGIAMMIAILSCVLAGTPFDHEMGHVYGPPYDKAGDVAHFFITIKISAFTDLGNFERRLSALMARVRQCRPLSDQPVLVAGDLERAAFECRVDEGIPITAADFQFFDELARELGVAFPTKPSEVATPALNTSLVEGG